MGLGLHASTWHTTLTPNYANTYHNIPMLLEFA